MPIRRFLTKSHLVALSLFLIAAPTLAQEQVNSQLPDIKASYELASGKYGTAVNSVSRTSSITASWYRDTYSVDVDVPYLTQSGPSRRIVIGAGRQIVINPAESAAGLGDVTLGYTRYLLNQEDRGIDFDMDATLKLPTASASKGLGSGKADLSLQGTAAHVWGRFSASTALGYTWVGKPADLGYHNVFFGSIDASVKVNDLTRVGATYSASQSITAGTAGTRDLMLYAEWKLSKKIRAEVFLSKGYSTQSADHAVGASGTLSF